MNPLHLWFHFPDGGIWSNILASVLWTTPSFIVGLMVSHRRLKKHINKGHQDLKDHISREHIKSRKHLEKRIGNYER